MLNFTSYFKRFDSNPWQTFFFIIILSNFLFLFNTSSVLFFSLFLIFIYMFSALTIFFHNQFVVYSSLRKNSLLTSLFDSISSLKLLKVENYKLGSFIFFLSSSFLTWFSSSIFYKCVIIPKNKNYLSFYLSFFLSLFTYTLSKKKFIVDLNNKSSFLIVL